MKKVLTELNELILRDDGILLSRSINPETPRTPELVGRMFDAITDLTGERPCPILLDPRLIPEIPPDGWLAIISRLEGLFTALAVLAPDDATLKLMEGYTRAFDRLLFPARIFRDESDALDWLRDFL